MSDVLDVLGVFFFSVFLLGEESHCFHGNETSDQV